MSRKNKSKRGRREDGASHKHDPTNTATERGRGPWRLTPITVGIGLGIVLLGAAALLSPALRNRASVAMPGAAAAATQPSSGAVRPARASLPAPGTRVPLNDADPVTGKPLTPLSPTLAYKGYMIGFCCDKSAGYLGSWDRMSEREKDAFVRKYLK